MSGKMTNFDRIRSSDIVYENARNGKEMRGGPHLFSRIKGIIKKEIGGPGR